jgi:hypothetical protein
MKTISLITPAFLIMIAAGVCLAQNDYICLKNGQTAKTTVKDTAGCRVIIIRGGASVQIEKSKIRYVRWGQDSISYETYACPDAPKKGVRFEDTPEYKIFSFLDTCPELSQVIKPGEKIGYVRGAIAGVLDKPQDSAVQETVVPLLSTRNTVLFLSADSLAVWISRPDPPCRYVFVTKKCVLEQNNDQTVDYKLLSTVKRKELILVVEFVMLDVNRKEIVFHVSTASKRMLYNSNGPASFENYLPGEVKQKIDDNRKNNAMAENMDKVIEKLEKELKQHLDIKDKVEF